MRYGHWLEPATEIGVTPSALKASTASSISSHVVGTSTPASSKSLVL